LQRGKAVHFADVDLNEDEDQVEKVQDDGDDDEEEEEEMDSEFISLVDVLDGKGDADMDDDGSAVLKRSLAKETTLAREVDANDKDAHEADEGAEESSSGEEEKLDFFPSDDEAAPEALDELENFVTSLETYDKKRKDHPDAIASTSQEPKRKKRQIIKERTEAGTENEFRAQASGTILTALIYVFLTIVCTTRLKA
jgi:U3 small nucleolar RNA-associated protein 14